MIALIGIVILQTQGELTDLVTSNLHDQTTRFAENIEDAISQLSKDLGGACGEPFD